MTESRKKTFCPDYMVVYCSSVWGGYSWALTDTKDKAQLRRLCKEMEDNHDERFHCCSLQELLSFKSGNRDVNGHMREFVAAIKNGEFEQFEHVDPAGLKAESLLEPRNEALLRDLLEEFFDTTYVSDAVTDFLKEQGIAVLSWS